MTDFTSYQPPGVYVDETFSPVSPTFGSNPSVVAIVGPSRGFRTHTEVIVANAAAPVPLSKLGIVLASVVVVGTNGTAYDLTGDYLLAAGAGADADLLATRDNTTTLALAVSSDISNGQTIRVTYNYVDEAFFQAIRVSSFEDVKDFYGEPINATTGAILSPLSLAAQIAFDNGAREVILASTEGSATSVTRAQLSAGYTKIQGLYDVSVVVPLPVGITGTVLVPGDTINVGTDLETHVVAASNGGFYRIGVLGLAKTVTVAPESVATGIASSRVVYAYPNRMLYFNPATNQTVEIDGFYLAAAYAGRICSQNSEVPLTKKLVRGLAGIPAAVLSGMTASAKNLWSEKGVAVTELTRQRNLTVRHGTTTDPSSLLTREISVVRAKDALIRLIEDSITSAGLIGQPIRDNTVLQVKGIVQGGLENAVDSGLIQNYQNLGARLRPGDPQIIEVKFEYRPSYPLNYISVVFSVNTSTGDTDLTVGTTVA